MENTTTLKRWRLILGEEAEGQINGMGGAALSAEELLMDSALSQIYGAGSGSSQSGGKGAGKGKSSPNLSRWLGDLRSLFAPMEVRVIQNDAINRCGMKQLLFEPEMLDTLEPDISTASLLLTLKDQIPTKAKENARNYIAKIVEDINRRLSDDVKRSVTSSRYAEICAATTRRESCSCPRNFTSTNARASPVHER